MSPRLPRRLAEAATTGVAVADALTGRIPGVGAGAATRTLTGHKLWGPLQGADDARGPERRLFALSFDLDYQRDTDCLDGLVELMGEAGVSASLCSIAALVARDPEPYRRALDGGHELVNHSWTHPDNPVLDPDREFWHLDEAAMAEQVSVANDLFEEHLGRRTSGFRTPHFKDAQRMIAVLDDDPDTTYLSTALATATATGRPFRPARRPQIPEVGHHLPASGPGTAGLIQLPLSACPEHRWSPFCSYHHLRTPTDRARGAGLHDLGTFAAHWHQMLADAADGDRGYLSTYFDPHDVMASPTVASTFSACLATTVAEGWEVVTLGQMARAWEPHLPAPEASA